MNESPYPGGQEEKYLLSASQDEETDGEETPGRRINNAYVTTPGRSNKAIRNELMQSGKHFIFKRINDNESDLLKGIIE